MASCQRNRGTSLDFCETRRQQGRPTSRGARLSDEQTRNPGATAEWTRILRDVTQKGGKVNQPKNFGHIFSFFFLYHIHFFFFRSYTNFNFQPWRVIPFSRIDRNMARLLYKGNVIEIVNFLSRDPSYDEINSFDNSIRRERFFSKFYF